VFPQKKEKIMSFAKSYKFTMIALALCAVGFFACSDSDSSSDANGEDNVLSIWVGDMLVNGETLILGMGEGTIIELDKLAGEPVDILVNHKPIAKGEVVVIDENFGVRVTEILSPMERVSDLR